MNNDILPPRPKQTPPVVENDAIVPPSEPVAVNIPQSNVPSPADGSTISSSPSRHKKYLRWGISGVVGLIALSCLVFLAWYSLSLRPVASGDVDKVRVTIIANSSLSQIGELLEENDIIRSKTAFNIYTRLNKVHNKLQAGTFSLSPAESTEAIVKHLTIGGAEEYTVTFYPGATLNIASTSTDKTPSHRQVLERLGFSDQEIDEAFNATYDHPLFAGKPAAVDLEGYIYGQTYQVASGSSVKQILTRTFDEYYAQIQKHNLVEGFSKQGLNLYQGITLASIIQREVPTEQDQKQVAQIFFTRLSVGMMLGSDVTYHYAADELGVPRDHTLDHPYNTRKYAGLPPGPIGSPGLSSLLAVAAPASGDYVYFLSGDDDKTYFAHTIKEHEKNIVDHCAYKCSLP